MDNIGKKEIELLNPNVISRIISNKTGFFTFWLLIIFQKFLVERKIFDFSQF